MKYLWTSLLNALQLPSCELDSERSLSFFSDPFNPVVYFYVHIFWTVQQCCCLVEGQAYVLDKYNKMKSLAFDESHSITAVITNCVPGNLCPSERGLVVTYTVYNFPHNISLSLLIMYLHLLHMIVLLRIDIVQMYMLFQKLRSCTASVNIYLPFLLSNCCVYGFHALGFH